MPPRVLAHKTLRGQQDAVGVACRTGQGLILWCFSGERGQARNASQARRVGCERANAPLPSRVTRTPRLPPFA